MLRTSEKGHIPTQGRRHFLGLAAAASARLAALATLGSAALTSSARADNGHHYGWSNERNPHSNCLLEGTRIQTASGEVAIEDLQVGDLVATIGGRTRRIRWIGRRVFQKHGPSWRANVMPVRVARGALAENTPHRDLYMSPEHALYLEGVLIPAKQLINGVSIAPGLPHDHDRLAYFNLLLDAHEVIMAEGAPAETYRPTAGNYENFGNFADYERLYSNAPWPALAAFAPTVARRGREHLWALLRLAAPSLVRGGDEQVAYERAYQRVAARAAQQRVS